MSVKFENPTGFGRMEIGSVLTESRLSVYRGLGGVYVKINSERLGVLSIIVREKDLVELVANLPQLAKS